LITRAVRGGPEDIFIGDVNYDGYNDITTANRYSDTISILRWDNISGDWDPRITFAVGKYPYSVFIEDADNNGYNDIVTANYGSNTVSIFLWKPYTLQVEIFEDFYSFEHFNFTFLVRNNLRRRVETAIFQLWWNGTDVSSAVQNHGNGYYFVSLEPITVALGEDPIILNMTISASGYEVLYYETFIAIDPDTLSGGNDPQIFGYNIITLVGVACVITLLILKKRFR